jgi:hypothetical protein
MLDPETINTIIKEELPLLKTWRVHRNKGDVAERTVNSIKGKYKRLKKELTDSSQATL